MSEPSPEQLVIDDLNRDAFVLAIEAARAADLISRVHLDQCDPIAVDFANAGDSASALQLLGLRPEQRALAYETARGLNDELLNDDLSVLNYAAREGDMQRATVKKWESILRGRKEYQHRLIARLWESDPQANSLRNKLKSGRFFSRPGH